VCHLNKSIASCFVVLSYIVVSFVYLANESVQLFLRCVCICFMRFALEGNIFTVFGIPGNSVVCR